MKLIDMLAGKKPDKDDPKDKPSGVKITFEPSVRLLEEIDAFAQESGVTRESAAAAYAALGYVSRAVTSKFAGAVADRADELRAGKDEADFRTQELRLVEATGKKEGFEEAAKACENIASRRAEIPREIALQCAELIRALKRQFVNDVTKRLKVKPAYFEGNRLFRALEVVASSEEAARIECEDPEHRGVKTNLRELAALRVAYHETLRPAPEDLARLFHDLREQLAPEFGLATPEPGPVPWEAVHEKTRRLLTAVCERILRALA